MQQLDATRSGILIGLSFPTHFRAQEFLLALQGLAASGRLLLKDAVTITSLPNGKVKVHETVDPTPGRAAITGVLWGSLFGLFAGGPLGWVIGAVLGGGGAALVAHFVDIGVTDTWVDWFKEVIRPETTTLAVLVDHLNAGSLLAEASRFPTARVIATSLDPLTEHQLRATLGEGPDPTQHPGQSTAEGTSGVGVGPNYGGFPHH